MALVAVDLIAWTQLLALDGDMAKAVPKKLRYQLLHVVARLTCSAMLKVRPTEVITDAAPVYPAVLDELVPSAWHHVEQHANNRVEADHSKLRHRLRPMRGLPTDRTAQTILADTLSSRTLRRGHYELGLDALRRLRVSCLLVGKLTNSFSAFRI